MTVGGRDPIPQVRAAGSGNQAQGALAAVRTAVAAIFGRLDAWQRLLPSLPPFATPVKCRMHA